MFFTFILVFKYNLIIIEKNVVARLWDTLFISTLSHFFETNPLVLQHIIPCPWFFESLISHKRFAMNSCYFINSFSLPLDKIFFFSFTVNANVLILTVMIN